MDIKLGQLTTNTKRDAVHVAICPVKAGQVLQPGQKISVKEGIAYLNDSTPNGVVDPFLINVVDKGQTFYALMNPGTVTNLRHEWDHSSLPVNEEAYDKTLEESEKEKVLRAFADEKGLSYMELLRIDMTIEDLREAREDNGCRGC